jgi:hypothetical protein
MTPDVQRQRVRCANNFNWSVTFRYCNAIQFINLNREICQKEQKATIYFYVNLETYGHSMIDKYVGYKKFCKAIHFVLPTLWVISCEWYVFHFTFLMQNFTCKQKPIAAIWHSIYAKYMLHNKRNIDKLKNTVHI